LLKNDTSSPFSSKLKNEIEWFFYFFIDSFEMYGGDEFDDDGHNTNTCTRWFYDIITLPRELVELEGKFVGFRFRYFLSIVPLVNWIYDLFFTSKVPG